MRVNITHIGLNDFFLRKSDIIYGLYHALSDLGYDTVVSHNQFDRRALNLIIGSDIVTDEALAIKQIIAQRVDYAVYEVENFNGSTVNYQSSFSLDNYLALIEGAQFVITPYAYNLPALESLFGKEKIRYAKWGYHGAMQTQNIDRTHGFEFDALFFGLIKGSRRKKYELLKNTFSNKLKLVDEKDPFTIRDYAVSKSRFGLSLSYGETDDFVNPFRLFHMAANKMPILADNINDKDGYLNICEQLNLNEMVNLILSGDELSIQSFEKCVEQSLAKNLKEVI